MTPDELKTLLEADGWRIEKDVLKGAVYYAWKRLEQAADCTSNEKPPCLCVNVYAPWREDQEGQVEIELCAAVVGDLWLDLKAYGLPISEAMPRLAFVTKVLRAAWNNAAGTADVMRETPECPPCADRNPV